MKGEVQGQPDFEALYLKRIFSLYMYMCDAKYMSGGYIQAGGLFFTLPGVFLAPLDLLPDESKVLFW